MPARRTARDEEFTTFVEDHSTRLLRYCLLLTGNRHDADDLLQASLLKAYQHWDRIDDPQHATGYLRTVITRTHVSSWRKTGRREQVSDQLPEVAVEASDPGPRDAMWRALAGLGERQRTVLVLRFYEDQTEQAIADAMGTSLGTVKSQLSRGLANLRTVMDAEGALR